LIVFPNAKINLGLRILRKRDDGYHDLETVFHPLPLFDALEMIRATATRQSAFTVSGDSIAGDPADNLCMKAYELLSRNFLQLPPVTIQLHKAIPVGAGLGGGSADGSFALILLNRLFKLELDEETLLNHAAALGSDCPFFIINKPVFATGRGEKMERSALDLSPYYFIVVNPGIHISTAEAFANIHPPTPGKSIKNIIAQPLSTWKEELVNDFEPFVFKQHPEVAEIKEQLYRAGAVYSAMSGSGSTVFGLFRKGEQPRLHFPVHYYVRRLLRQA
jgi:4-diphosphocytidyl-2-C-methyl-D-erythritol kinase